MGATGDHGNERPYDLTAATGASPPRNDRGRRVALSLRPSAGDGGDGEGVDEIVHRVAAVALDPAPRHGVGLARARSAVATDRRWRPARAWRCASRWPPTSPTTGRGSS